MTPEPLSVPQRIRRLGNLVNLSSPLGLVVAGIGGARLSFGSRGLVFAEGYRPGFPNAGAFTVGNVIITSRTIGELALLQPDVLDHEDAHAWQYFWCLGLPFLPLYLASAGWSWLRTGDPASANAFERRAGLERGGYLERPSDNAGLRRLASALRRGLRRE